MKALILSGGMGTRLRPLTHTIAKQLVPVAGKPILGYVLDHISEAKIDDVGIIISPETGHHVKSYIGNGEKWGIKPTFIIQDKPLGLAHAVLTAENFLANDRFVMYLGDNLLSYGLNRAIERFNHCGAEALIFLKEVDDPKRFGVAELDEYGNVFHLVEKPASPPTNLALVGVYIFTNRIFEAISHIKPSARNELEITDAIEELIHMGCNVKSEILKGWWLDTGKKDDLLQANTIVLDEYARLDIKGFVDSESSISGRVTIEKDVKIINSNIRGPVNIGEKSIIKDSFIGPFTSIGSNVSVNSSVIEHSVILNEACIEGIERLEDSVLGRNTEVKRNDRHHKALRLLISDDSVVEV